MNKWQFDLVSALLGAVVALTLVGLGYALREPLLRGWEEVQATLRRAVERITAGVEKRYRERTTAWAQKTHALSMLGPLEQFFVPPRLIPPPPHPDPDREMPPTQEPIPLGIALKEHHRVLLIGPLASGRTTLLAYLALVHARGEASPSIGLPIERLPLYLHLESFEEVPQNGEEVDEVDRLVQEAIEAVGSPSAAKGVIRQHLHEGTALVLIDGWDELSPPGRERATAWLASLVDTLPDNLWVVTVGPRGYGPLAEMGFVSLRMRGWERQQVETFLKQAAEALAPPDAGEGVPSSSLSAHAVELLEERLKQEPSLLDLALGSWLLLSTGEMPQTRNALFARALERLMRAGEETDLPTAARAALDALALRSYREDRLLFSEEEVRAAVEAASPPSEERLSRFVSQVMKRLTAPGGPLSRRGKERYTFSHPLWWAWLVAHQAHTSSPTALVERLDDPRWLPVVDFYAEEGEMGPVVEAWLSKPDDLWRTRLQIAARWALRAPSDAPWRNGVMALLARAFLAPSLPAEVRERLGEALVRTQDPGVGIFLRQALQHPRESVRAAAARAMGLLGDKADLSLLGRALHDSHENVRAAAAHALGEVGTPGALRRLATVLTEAEETLRIEAARGLALAGKEGWEILREATEAEDFLTRRAAAFGLAEVKAPWVRSLLERIVREDEEWIVRSAASTALTAFEQARPTTIDPPPDPSQAGWLITWAAERGEGVGVGKAAFDALLKALTEGDAPIRRAAAHTLGLIGRPEHADALRQAVDDPEPEVARTALWALEELVARYDLYIQ